MNILGIYGAFAWDCRRHWIHDSGCTLISNGEHKISISEERLTKRKYEGQFPIESINYCLSSSNLLPEDIDLIVYPSTYISDFYEQQEANFIKNFINEKFPNAKLEIISHHLAHAYASVYSSEFDEGSFITLDGTGSLFRDYYGNTLASECSSIGYFNKKKHIFRFFPSVPEFNKFGHFYQTWSHNIYCQKTEKNIAFGDPDYRETFAGKVMGLSAYGKAKNFDEKQYKICTEGIPLVSFKDYGPYDNPDYNHMSADDKAATIQKIFEDCLLDYIKQLNINNYLEENLCVSGGIFLNILANTKVKKYFKNFYVPPFTSDCGLHFGAASYGLFLNKQNIKLPNNLALLGKEYSDNEILKSLKVFNLNYEHFSSFEDLCSIVAKYLQENKIVAWFQGRSEFGPRALGSRSILSNAKYKNNKDLINSRIKHREYWRPFAGIMLEEYISEYFEEGLLNPYMLYSQTVKQEKIKDIEAITHEDNTCRIQTVNSTLNSQITTLLTEYKKLSGVPILLNTSFNDNGQPIVESPEDAINAFINMDIDCIVMGNYIAKK